LIKGNIVAFGKEAGDAVAGDAEVLISIFPRR